MCFILSISVCSCAVVDISDSTTAELRFIHGDKNIETEMSAEDLSVVTEILNGKVLYSENLSCGFSKDIAVVIDNQTFCLACDDCATIYLLEEDKYFNISEEENAKLKQMLTLYGFDFPCY
ncbi:MAG: hypothetical protein E7603_04170 [Ruminococcaceae bacterium]|nr:hypothetical protein [Oscillospiraceae bacterium]